MKNFYIENEYEYRERDLITISKIKDNRHNYHQIIIGNKTVKLEENKEKSFVIRIRMDRKKIKEDNIVFF